MGVAYTYLTVQNILKDEDTFLKEKDHRKIVVALSLETVNDLDLNLFFGHNCEKHSNEDLLQSIIFTVSNILLKNYSKKRNDVVNTKTMPHFKRLKPNN